MTMTPEEYADKLEAKRDRLCDKAVGPTWAEVWVAVTACVLLLALLCVVA